MDVEDLDEIARKIDRLFAASGCKVGDALFVMSTVLAAGAETQEQLADYLAAIKKTAETQFKIFEATGGKDGLYTKKPSPAESH